MQNFKSRDTVHFKLGGEQFVGLAVSYKPTTKFKHILIVDVEAAGGDPRHIAARLDKAFTKETGKTLARVNVRNFSVHPDWIVSGSSKN